MRSVRALVCTLYTVLGSILAFLRVDPTILFLPNFTFTLRFWLTEAKPNPGKIFLHGLRLGQGSPAGALW
jgi:hypothetical protein